MRIGMWEGAIYNECKIKGRLIFIYINNFNKIFNT